MLLIPRTAVAGGGKRARMGAAWSSFAGSMYATSGLPMKLARMPPLERMMKFSTSVLGGKV